MLQCIRTISMSVFMMYSLMFKSIVLPVSSHLSLPSPHSRLQSDSATMSVKSKNLFNFPAQGSYDEDVAAFMAQEELMKKELSGEESGPFLKWVELWLYDGQNVISNTCREHNSEEVNTGILRKYMKVSFEKLLEVPHYQKILASCETEEMMVPNTNNIKIIIHTPHSLQDTEVGGLY